MSLKIIDEIQAVPPNWLEVVTFNQPSIIRKTLMTLSIIEKKQASSALSLYKLSYNNIPPNLIPLSVGELQGVNYFYVHNKL